MLKQIGIVLFLFINFPLLAQENLRNEFLNQIFDSISTDTLKCSSEIPVWINSKLIEVLEIEGSGFLAKGQNKKCDLSKEERMVILDLIKNKQIKAITDFASRLVVSTKEYKEKVANMEGGQIFTFSDPIFFRDNSMVFFFQNRYCGPKCAEGRWSVYTIESGKWVECLVLLSYGS
jgi:hypothetical protein